MLSFHLNVSLSKNLQKLQNAFIEAYSRVKQLDKETLVSVQRFARISSIGASTRIENALLTDSEVSWMDTLLTTHGKTTAFSVNQGLIVDKLSKDRQRSIEEVAGCRNMMQLILSHHADMLPLKEADIRALHHELMSPFAGAVCIGRYKEQPNFVVETHHATGQTRLVFQTADAGIITSLAMMELVKWYNEIILSAENTVTIASEFVFRFLAIHPFQDGNGRLGRALFLLVLLQSPNLAIQTLAPLLAIDRQIEKRKEEYYFTLNRCSHGQFQADPKNYHIEYFCAFMEKAITDSLNDIDFYIKKHKSKQALSGNAQKVLHCFDEYPEIKLSTKELMQMTHLPRRTILNILNTLLKHQLIQAYGAGAARCYQVTF